MKQRLLEMKVLVPYYRIKYKVFDKEFFLYDGSTIDNQLFTKCEFRSKKWKRHKTAEKWLDANPYHTNAITIEKVIYDDYFKVEVEKC